MVHQPSHVALEGAKGEVEAGFAGARRGGPVYDVVITEDGPRITPSPRERGEAQCTEARIYKT
ncbi:MAG: hypothetical protein AUI86_10615 [Gemmatimonadetes bacterium 13_1_40CM_3_66_12]|nr:MAG: hypothetical protein AUI86_10615 [Gemmatimonadetes bacterium 13_1_40CM_3_66_12]